MMSLLSPSCRMDWVLLLLDLVLHWCYILIQPQCVWNHSVDRVFLELWLTFELMFIWKTLFLSLCQKIMVMGISCTLFVLSTSENLLDVQLVNYLVILWIFILRKLYLIRTWSLPRKLIRMCWTMWRLKSMLFMVFILVRNLT